MRSWLNILIWIFTLNQAYAQPITDITVVTGEWPPYTTQTLTGYGITSSVVIQAFAARGVAVEFKWLPFKRAFSEAREANYDGTIPWFKIPEREKYFYFSDPVGFSDTMIWYNKKSPLFFDSIDSLKGVVVGGTIGYSYGKKFDKASQAEFNYELARSDLINLKKLALGRIEAFPCDKEVCLSLVKQHLTKEEANALSFAEKPLVSIPTYFLVSKKHKYAKEIVHEINTGLKLINFKK
ncbi:substrate-binding periplasmic protein [Piscirickettsia litoralis]|uniref:Solute-binding protein family 3/N-terminal domain-containing protein n=1 Tax=Piscirickettsia litoralis TaxID=1891921 RepID=A0ABX2ZYZ7_9GAMM|nr:transporter substrate-binding domain-containing protein [Piscirickettsia litoralis]ODN41430.1 hypothetical protein BGC07_16845 [Piscirickettsia litoralis]